jgi:hypothetical protein
LCRVVSFVVCRRRRRCLLEPGARPRRLAQVYEGRPQRMRKSRGSGCGCGGVVLLLALPLAPPRHPPALKRHRGKEGRTAGKWKAAQSMAYRRALLPFAVQARNQSWKDQA